MGPELLLRLPRGTFQVIVLERMNEDFRLIQPRRVGGRVTRLPPAVASGKVCLRRRRYVARPAILDQEDTPQLLVVLAVSRLR